jgi:hypothetical protein
MGVSQTVKHIRSTEDDEANPYNISQSSVYQIIADHRKCAGLNGAA